MDIASVMVGVALLLIVAALVARPLLMRQTQAGDSPTPEIDGLVARREAVLTALRDLDFDHATGKIEETDYATQRKELLSDGVAIMKQLDALGVTLDDPHAPETALTAAIEQAVAARRTVVPAARSNGARDGAGDGFCTQCGTAYVAGDRFCSKCGKPLGEAQPEASN